MNNDDTAEDNLPNQPRKPDVNRRYVDLEFTLREIERTLKGKISSLKVEDILFDRGTSEEPWYKTVGISLSDIELNHLLPLHAVPAIIRESYRGMGNNPLAGYAHPEDQTTFFAHIEVEVTPEHYLVSQRYLFRGHTAGKRGLHSDPVTMPHDLHARLDQFKQRTLISEQITKNLGDGRLLVSLRDKDVYTSLQQMKSDVLRNIAIFYALDRGLEIPEMLEAISNSPAINQEADTTLTQRVLPGVSGKLKEYRSTINARYNPESDSIEFSDDTLRQELGVCFPDKLYFVSMQVKPQEQGYQLRQTYHFGREKKPGEDTRRKSKIDTTIEAFLSTVQLNQQQTRPDSQPFGVTVTGSKFYQSVDALKEAIVHNIQSYIAPPGEAGKPAWLLPRTE